LRETHSHEEQLRAARANLLRNLCGFFRSEIAVTRTGHGQPGIAALQLRSCALGDSRRAAEKKNGDALLCGARAEMLEQFDTRHTLAKIRAARTRDREQPHRIAERKR